jgi:hypothetical protein
MATRQRTEQSQQLGTFSTTHGTVTHMGTYQLRTGTYQQPTDQSVAKVSRRRQQSQQLATLLKLMGYSQERAANQQHPQLRVYILVWIIRHRVELKYVLLVFSILISQFLTAIEEEDSCFKNV